jgi:hypothetical protein
MLKPQIPNIPGVGVMTDTLDFVKNLWGSMSVPGVNLPGLVSPTLNVDELDKKIADLKAVEAWLNVNTSMVRGTIQALEVQRGTISTLKSMGANLAQAVKQPDATEKSVLEAAPFAEAFFRQPVEEALKEAKPKKAKEKDKAESSLAGAALGTSAAWWNLLQDQFKQAVKTATVAEPAAAAPDDSQPKSTAAAKTRAAAKPRAARKPAPKT